MAAKYTIKGNTGESAARDLMIAYLNTGTSSAPVWSPMGRTVEDSSVEYDYSQETKTDILGETHVTAKTPTATQTFSGNNLIAGDAVLYISLIWQSCGAASPKRSIRTSLLHTCI